MVKTDEEKFSVRDFKYRLVDNQTYLVFQGMFSQDILSLMGLTLKRIPNSEVISKRLFGMVVEMAQNIHHYSAQRMFSDKDQREIGVGVIAISETDHFYVVSSGNYITNKDREVLEVRSAFINSLDEDQLREYYREQRKQPQRVGKPGANLGLIDMRRKSGNTIDVRIESVDNEISFFILSVKIRKEYNG